MFFFRFRNGDQIRCRTRLCGINRHLASDFIGFYQDQFSFLNSCLKCTLQFGDEPDPTYHNAYTLLNIIFYILTPMPLLVASKVSEEGGLAIDLAGDFSNHVITGYFYTF